MTKIYISSTYSDLVEHRQQVYDILRKMRYDVMAMEDYVATDQRPLDKCLADVISCQVYVGIFAWRYGYIPPGQEQSITELEYRQAGQSDLERLIFLLHEDAPWPRNKMEKGVGGEKIEALRGELMAAHQLQFFKSPEELAGQVAASVSRWAQARLDADMDRLRSRRDQADRQRREMRARQRVVNLRPLDVAHFKDRLREIHALCDHLADGGVRLVSVVGRGGMGKTALACRVLADLEHGIQCTLKMERWLLLLSSAFLFPSAWTLSRSSACGNSLLPGTGPRAGGPFRRQGGRVQGSGHGPRRPGGHLLAGSGGAAQRPGQAAGPPARAGSRPGRGSRPERVRHQPFPLSGIRRGLCGSYQRMR